MIGQSNGQYGGKHIKTNTDRQKDIHKDRTTVKPNQGKMTINNTQKMGERTKDIATDG